MSYKSLKVLSYGLHGDKTALEKEYQNRISSKNAILTDLSPNYMDGDMVSPKDYPLFVVLTSSLTDLINEVEKNSEKLTKLQKNKTSDIMRGAVIEEVYSTNKLEGVEVTKDEVKNAYSNEDVRFSTMVNMYAALAKSILIPKTLQDIRHGYEGAVLSEIDKNQYPKGRYFRSTQQSIQIGDTLSSIYYPPADENKLERSMQLWLNFMNGSDIPSLVKIMLGHYFFEATHPFMDGNGRLGRYFVSLYLAAEVDPLTAIVFARAVDDNFEGDAIRSETKYYKAFKNLNDVQNFGEGTFFIQSMLEILIKGQKILIAEMS